LQTATTGAKQATVIKKKIGPDDQGHSGGRRALKKKLANLSGRVSMVATADNINIPLSVPGRFARRKRGTKKVNEARQKCKQKQGQLIGLMK